MRPVEQAISSPPNGDCLRACIASILELGIDDLPNPVGVDWADQWGDFLGARGYSYLEVSLENPGRCWWSLSDEQYWIAAVPSLNYPGCFHAVVMKGGELVHDPSPNKRYAEVRADIIRDMTFIVPNC